MGYSNKSYAVLSLVLLYSCGQTGGLKENYTSPFLDKSAFVDEHFQGVFHPTHSYREKLVREYDVAKDTFHYYLRPRKLIRKNGWNEQDYRGNRTSLVKMNRKLRTSIFGRSLGYKPGPDKLKRAHSYGNISLETMHTTRIIEEGKEFISTIIHSECGGCNNPTNSVTYRFSTMEKKSLAPVSLERVLQTKHIPGLSRAVAKFKSVVPAECAERLKLTSLTGLKKALAMTPSELFGFVVYRRKLYIDMYQFMETEAARKKYPECELNWIHPAHYDFILKLNLESEVSTKDAKGKQHGN